MRMLVIDDEVRARAAEIVKHAETNPYKPPYDRAPGDDPRNSMEINTFRAVFSRTVLDGVEFRHLSVSVPGGLYPNPEATFMIAELFGFTGYEIGRDMPLDWACMPKKFPVMCVEIAQPVRSTMPRERMS